MFNATIFKFPFSSAFCTKLLLENNRTCTELTSDLRISVLKSLCGTPWLVNDTICKRKIQFAPSHPTYDNLFAMSRPTFTLSSIIFKINHLSCWASLFGAYSGTSPAKHSNAVPSPCSSLPTWPKATTHLSMAGFFNGAANVDARYGVFNSVNGDQTNHFIGQPSNRPGKCYQLSMEQRHRYSK